VTLLDSEGEPDDALAAVTVTVTRADGTALVTAQAATDAGTSRPGVWTYPLTAAQLASLDLLAAVWTSGGVARATTLHDVVGGFYFTVAQIKARESSLSSKSSDEIQRERAVAEWWCERICGFAWVPRYRRVTLNGTGTAELELPDPAIRSIRAVSVDDVALTSTQLAELEPQEDGTLEWPSNIWASGRRNVIVAYEYGEDRPPEDVVRAAMTHTRHLLHQASSAIHDRTTSFTTEAGQTFRLDTAGPDKVGIPSVDAVYQSYSGKRGGQAAARPLQFDPQRNSLFHGGVR